LVEPPANKVIKKSYASLDCRQNRLATIPSGGFEPPLMKKELVVKTKLSVVP